MMPNTLLKNALSLYLTALGWKFVYVVNVDFTTSLELRHTVLPLRLTLI